MKVLLAVDHSKISQVAMNALIAHVNPKEADILVLHVLEPVSGYPRGQTWGYVLDAEHILEEQRESGKELLTRVSKALGEKGFNVATALEEGNPKAVILDSAAKWGADLIILGSHGRRGVDRFLLGSVSEAVARHANCSVEIVRA